MVINDGKFEYYNINKTESKIDFELTDNNYTLCKLSKIFKLAIPTINNYCEYLNLNIFEDSNNHNYRSINKSDVKVLIDWCNKYSKIERSNIIIKNR